MNNRPSKDEYPAYFETYISLVPDGRIEDILHSQLEETRSFLVQLTDEQANHRYAEGKWSVKEVVGHMTDTERVMQYRLLCIGRGDQTPLPGFDEMIYMQGVDFHSCSMEDLLEDLTAVRHSTLMLLKSLPESAWSNSGTANNSHLTARALAYIIAGHVVHHVRVIKERYLY